MFTGNKMVAYCLPKSAGYAMIHSKDGEEGVYFDPVCLPIMVPMHPSWMQGEV